MNYIIIVAGGVGSRMNNELPKQFIKVNHKEIIIHCILRFLRFDPAIQIIIPVHKSYSALLTKILAHYQIKNATITEGGATRFDSVKNALALVTDPMAVVGIHDAARPLVSLDVIKRCFHTAKEKGNATPVMPVNETLRECLNNSNRWVNRKNFRIIQTPQCFIASQIKKAFELPYSENFTDDASVLEASGEKIILVEGNPENIKITNPHDLLIAKVFLENEQR